MRIVEIIKSIALRYFIRKKLPQGHCGQNSHIHTPSIIGVGSPDNIFLGDNVSIDWNSVLYCVNAKFIVGNNTRAAVGLTVISGNHTTKPGETIESQGNEGLTGKDVVIEEEVWLGANVTLLAGTKIGRGAIVGAGSVVAGKCIPPYAMVMGNPCKIVGFRFTPEEVIEHEKILYPEGDRLKIEILQKNYDKYFLKRLKDINEFTKL